MSPDSICREPFLIIAGVAKAGTTSLFRYFAAHPQVRACRFKEPWYFLDPCVPFPTRPRIALDELKSYLALFPRSFPGGVALEASANYFHYPDIARVIARTLPEARIVVALREPISRLRSQFQMGLLRGWMPAQTSFDAFVNDMMAVPDAAKQAFGDWYMLDEGLYVERLRRWLTVFGPDRLKTVWFDDLASSPRAVAADIASFAGLDPAFFETYRFTVENAATVQGAAPVRRLYRRLKQAVGARWPSRFAVEAARRLLSRVETPLARWVTRPATPVAASPSTVARLRDFYRADVLAMTAMLGPAPWTDQYRLDVPAGQRGDAA